ncbi:MULTISPECIES: HNH endonuclease [Burkholderia]|uniref:HNH endonuclease n=1 Tax=Burkholderia TaxID=32008 RepID=UPI0005554BCB|nr:MULTISPECIES: HNH endonuclease signature motif containing protein [Burkholderia]MBR8428833.1 HNH endonuclease [Burkholderia cenocepacia]MDN7670846.1 HNH endonuclease signature motif containing protein [Burkholderia vietnamiensis]
MTIDDPTVSQAVRQLPRDRAILLRNETCAYCGRRFGPLLLQTKEHVIGRRFVPKGTLAGQWNLILYACSSCNRDKSDLEDDISVISMMPDAVGRYAIDDERLYAEVKRKAAGSRSRQTGKLVGDSNEKIDLKGDVGLATFAITFTAPPQVNHMRMYRLANYHFRAFFYWMTFQKESNLGGFVGGGFFPLAVVPRSDWGAARVRWFMGLVQDWKLKIHGVGADGFFRVLIRRPAGGERIWAWAFEWNHSFRVMGFAGEEDAIQALIRQAPEQSAFIVQRTAAEIIRVRAEESLADDQDNLFAPFPTAGDDVRK